MAKLFHITAYPAALEAGVGCSFFLRPGTQCAQGRGVYFSEGKYRECAAEGALGKERKVAVMIDSEESEVRQWWRSKQSAKKKRDATKSRTWHSAGKWMVCTVRRRFIDDSGTEVVECGYQLKQGFELVPALAEASLCANATALIERMEKDITQDQRNFSMRKYYGSMSADIYEVICSTLGQNNLGV